MKRSLALLAFLTAGNVVAAQLTVAVTLAMDAGTLSDLAAAVARELPAAGVEIDPAFFRRYRITDAPVFVLEGDETADGCEGNRPAVVIRGNVTAGCALREMQRALTDVPGADSSLKAVLQPLEELNVW